MSRVPAGAWHLPPALAELFARHRPVGPRELFPAWVDRAAALGLAVCEVGDVNAAAFSAGLARPDGPYGRSEVEVILDALEGQARRRRGQYRLVADPGRPVSVVADPDGGSVDNLAAVLRDFTALAAEQRHRVIVAAADLEGDERAARRHAVSARSIRRWRREGAGQNSPSVAAKTAENGRRLSA